MRYVSTAVGCLWLLLTAVPARAEITWEADEVTRDMEYGDGSVEAEFAFANTGKSTVTITKVESSCHCTVPTLEKRTYEPGEKGTIKAVYTPTAGMYGRDQKMIKVETDDPQQPLSIVRFTIYVHPVVETRPGAVYWGNGAEPAEKSVTVKLRGKAPFTGLTATTEQPGFHVSVEAVEPGREYHVKVRPESTTQVRAATIQLKPVGAAELNLPYPPQFSVGVMAPGIEPPPDEPPATQP